MGGRAHAGVRSAGARRRPAGVRTRSSQATAFGADAYADIHHKAAALLHSLARDHALVDGNKRLALAATLAFYGVNGLRLTLTNDEAYRLVVSAAAGEVTEVAALAEVLERGTAPRS